MGLGGMDWLLQWPRSSSLLSQGFYSEQRDPAHLGPADGVGWVPAYGEICGWEQLMLGGLSWNIGFKSKGKS